MTIREIAEKLGVSPAAVSLVLNNKPGVGEKRRQLIQNALRENGYQLRFPEKKILSQQICIIKCRASHQNDEFSILVLDAIEEYANRAGYTVSLVNITNDTYEQKIAALDLENLCGIIFFASDMQEKCLQYTMRIPLPKVYLDGCFSDRSINTVNIDQRLIANMAAEHLHKLGHVDIGYLRCVPTRSDLKQRFIFFKAAAERLGLNIMDNFVFDIDSTSENVERVIIPAFTDSSLHPSAIFGESDVIAAKCIQNLLQLGISVPEDISVIGIDNTRIALFSSPTLTVIDVNARELGRMAIDRLQQILADPSRAIVHSYIEPFLVQRESTCRKRA